MEARKKTGSDGGSSLGALPLAGGMAFLAGATDVYDLFRLRGPVVVVGWSRALQALPAGVAAVVGMVADEVEPFTVTIDLDKEVAFLLPPTAALRTIKLGTSPTVVLPPGRGALELDAFCHAASVKLSFKQSPRTRCGSI